MEFILKFIMEFILKFILKFTWEFILKFILKFTSFKLFKNITSSRTHPRPAQRSQQISQLA